MTEMDDQKPAMKPAKSLTGGAAAGVSTAGQLKPSGIVKPESPSPMSSLIASAKRLT